MHRSKIVLLTTALFSITLAAGAVSVEKGTEINPSGSNAVYELGQDLNFSSITVYSDKINLSTVNITTSTGSAVKITLWQHNLSRNGSTVAKYHYNRSATTSFYNVGTGNGYEILQNGSALRTVSGQKFINITAPGNTNITVNDVQNTAPNTPSNPSPADTSTDADYDPSLAVDVSDPDGGTLNVSFYNNANDNRIGFEEVSSGSTASTTWSGLSSGTTYSWYANVSDSYETVQSATYSFTTNYDVSLKSDAQFYTNYSTNHEFAVEAYANDTDGENDITTCTVDYSAPGGSGTISGNILTSYGDGNDVKCNANLSDSLSDVDVGESVTTSVNFFDGQSWANSSSDSNPVPNNPPTLPGTKTDLGGFIADHTPAVQWLGEADPDGDSMTIELYTDSSATPDTLDNSGSSGLSQLDLGNSVTLEDNTTYYWRLRICDTYNLCSSYSSSDQFRMNEEPVITELETNVTSPEIGDSVRINATVKDRNIEAVNFTVWEGDTRIVNNTNGTWAGEFWTSLGFKADQNTVYNYSVTAIDNSSETTVNTSSFNTGYEKTGRYTRTFETSKQVTEIRPKIYGNFSNGGLTVRANTSADTPATVQNNTWLDVADGKNFTVILDIQGDGSTAISIDSYTIDYRTEYKSPGTYTSQIENMSNIVEFTEITVSEDQPAGTNLTYEFRVGNSSTVDGSWTNWDFCLNDCNPALPDARYIQFRANLTGTALKTPELNSVEVSYE